MLFIDAMSGKSIATCDAPITTCVLTNGVAVDAGMMRACHDAGPTTAA